MSTMSIEYTYKQLLEAISRCTNQLDEAGIALNGKAYPKSGNILFLAGGAASGKSFVLGNLLLFDGKILNPDNIKQILVKGAKSNNRSQLVQDFDDTHPYKLRDINLNDPNQTTDLHYFVKDHNDLDAQAETQFFKDDARRSHRPGSYLSHQNAIFDVTLRSPGLFNYYASLAVNAGYDTKDMHVVWVLSPMDAAVKNNLGRDRSVPHSILAGGHVGAAKTMLYFMQDSSTFSADGEGWIVFNNKYKNDIKVAKSDKGLVVVNGYVACRFKKSGEPSDIGAIPDELRRKIVQYVPDEMKARYQQLFT